MSPMMDVSVALTNPYTLDTFDVIRRPETINTYGESNVTSTTILGLNGVVFPEGQQSLDRRPDSQLQAKGIAVITNFALRGNSKDSGVVHQPDLVVWHGNQYVVIDVEDYSAYGPGFIKASCNLMNLTAQAPETDE